MINRQVVVQLPRIAAQSQQPFRWELSNHTDVQNIVAVAAPAGFEIGKWLGIPEEMAGTLLVNLAPDLLGI